METFEMLGQLTGVEPSRPVRVRAVPGRDLQDAGEAPVVGPLPHLLVQDIVLDLVHRCLFVRAQPVLGVVRRQAVLMGVGPLAVDRVPLIVAFDVPGFARVCALLPGACWFGGGAAVAVGVVVVVGGVGGEGVAVGVEGDGVDAVGAVVEGVLLRWPVWASR